MIITYLSHLHDVVVHHQFHVLARHISELFPHSLVVLYVVHHISSACTSQSKRLIGGNYWSRRDQTV